VLAVEAKAAQVEPLRAQPNFVHLGAISSLGDTTDYAMAYDQLSGKLYFFETETVATGRLVEMQ
jgi:hypothetical protein